MTNKPIDLDRALSQKGLKDRVELVGIELEGGWGALPPGVNALVHDGSVQIDPILSTSSTPFAHPLLAVALRPMQQGRMSFATASRRANELGFTNDQLADAWREYTAHVSSGNRVHIHTGELPSKPLQIKEVEPWMRAHYPQHVNGTCGLHVHMSFKHALHYQRLLTPSYMWTILHYVTLWAKKEGLKADHPIWPRLQGKSEYCQHKFHGDVQAQRKDKDHDRARGQHRYTVVSYHFNRLNTVEVRLLPMMETVDQGIRAVQHILLLTNAFLFANAKREEKLIGRVDIGPEDDVLKEVRRETV